MIAIRHRCDKKKIVEFGLLLLISFGNAEYDCLLTEYRVRFAGHALDFLTKLRSIVDERWLEVIGFAETCVTI
jgi:hypothetical protein